MLPGCFKPRPDGIEIQLQCTPGSRRNQIGMVVDHPHHGQILKIAVTVPPEDGKANAAIIALLAKEWRLPKTGFSLESGATARIKRFLIAGDGKALQKNLESWYHRHMQKMAE